MLIIFSVTLLLSSTVSCVDQICRFNQTGTCYAALGHKLSLQMVQDTPDLELMLEKQINTSKTYYKVLVVKKNRIRDEHESIRNRFEFIMNNGTLIINSVIRADSGRYTLKILNSQGSQTHAVDLQVNVEAPIGSVEVSIICSSSGVKEAFCSSEGEELLFSWTLNGDPLTLKDGNKSFIHLDEETSGNITCSVKNHVSHGEKSTTVNSCTGVDQICRFNQTGTCYAALGHKLSLQMVQDTPDLELKLEKQINTSKTYYKVLAVKKNRIRDEHESIRNRFEFIMKNVILIINNVTKEDSGRYTLRIFNSAGSQTHAVDLQVNVEAPIGSVEVSIICSSSGVKGAFCSSEGEELLFSWTLNGDPLTLKDGNKSFIHLDEETSGNITCSVKNHVSHGEKSTTVNSCTARVSLVFVMVWSLEMMILLLLLGASHIYIRRYNTHTSGRKQEEGITL